jgi:hypothetical protein
MNRISLALAFPILATGLLVEIAGPIVAQSTPRQWATYLGGNHDNERTQAVTTAGNGDIVVAGSTQSTNFKTTSGAYQPKSGGATDTFIARVSADGKRLIAATHLGGKNNDVPSWVRVAPDGTIWVGGTTQSSNFPVTANAFMKPTLIRSDAFVTQFDAALTKVLYSTAYGGLAHEKATGFALDPITKTVYIAGITSATVPTTKNAIRQTLKSADGFLAALTIGSNATKLTYGTLLGGTGIELSIDGLSLHNSLVTVTGTTQSTDFPATTGAFQTTGKGNRSGFVMTINPAGAVGRSLVYASYFRGSGVDQTLRHLTDAKGLTHLLLLSTSTDLPTTANALQAKAVAQFDVYYAQLDRQRSGSSALRYGSWLIAGNSNDGVFGGNIGLALTKTTTGVAAVAVTGSNSLHGTARAFQPDRSTRRAPGKSGFAVALNLTGANPAIDYASHYYGCRQTIAIAIATHSSGDLLLAGFANGVPVVSGVLQEKKGSNTDGFVGRLQRAPMPTSFRTFGSACRSSLGLPKIAIAGPARLCQTLLVNLSNLPPNKIGLFLFGPQVPPIPFDSVGAPGCSVFVNALVFVGHGTGNTGAFTLGIPVPGDHTLLGQELPMQFLFTDPKANRLGAAFTSGLAAKARW